MSQVTIRFLTNYSNLFQRTLNQYLQSCVRGIHKMAELDNLEYYIKFPSPNYDYSQCQRENDFVCVVNDERIPVILLFGWAGCQDKYLSKYSHIYEEKG